nr:Phosphoglucomutase-2 [Polyrhizophydium stewartii]
MGAGYARMNELTVIQASQGVCAYYLETVPDFKEKGIVVGHDHRHNSAAFARLTAAVFASKGVKVYFYRDLVHTPLVPFGVGLLGAGCGVMITASHNPKQDNGYKLYAGNGCQIISPHDKNISDHILNNLVPWTWDHELVNTSPLVSDPSEQVRAAYFAKLKTLSVFHEKNATQHVKMCYTAMHGVGLRPAVEVFSTFGLTPFVQVAEQVQPDPEFPTVAYPNPEEGKGALLLAMQTADKHGATLIFANDPDADRLAIAEKLPSGSWHIFNGNEIGSILGSLVLESLKISGGAQRPLAMISTTVSMHMLKQIAKQEGFRFEETLTGFKWLGNRAKDLEKEGYHVAFAYEEAIGFMVGDAVRDKDGISALGFAAEWANHLASQGKTLHAHLMSLYEKYGYFTSNNGYFICHEQPVINALFDDIRYGRERVASQAGAQYKFELRYPTEIGGSKVVWVRDLTVGYDSAQPDHKPTLPVSASSQMLTFELENGALITLRTSGTEPKIKYYTELRAPTLDQARTDLQAVVDSMIEICLRPAAHNLKTKAD